LASEHKKSPHLRLLQKKLATNITLMVHSPEGLEMAIEASEILFGKGTAETLKKLDVNTLLSIFEGVPRFTIDKESLKAGVNIVDLLGERTAIFPSKGEVRRTIKGGGVSLNKVKVEDESLTLGIADLLNNSYLLVQKGKKNYYLITANN